MQVREWSPGGAWERRGRLLSSQSVEAVPEGAAGERGHLHIAPSIRSALSGLVRLNPSSTSTSFYFSAKSKPLHIKHLNFKY